MRSLFRCAVVGFLFALSVHAQQQSDLALSFGANTATLTGLTPNARALFFIIGFEQRSAYRVFIRKAVVVDAVNGSAVFNYGKAVPLQTIWAAVDLQDGRYVIAAPAGFTPGTTTLPSAAFQRLSAGEFAFDHPMLEMLYVHPGHGAWTWSAMDGRLLDLDGPNGMTRVALDAGTPVDGTGHVSSFVPGGSLIAVDPYKMQVVATRLTGAMVGGGQ